MSRSLFQSTLPGWGATDRGQAGDDRNGISIHAPRMGSDPRAHVQRVRSAISIRAPRMGSDAVIWRLINNLYISIHAPRMGSDLALGSPNTGVTYFNPRSPDGERPGLVDVLVPIVQFQSTLPGWGATGRSQSAMSLIQISIHAPRIGSDKFDCVVASGPAWISIHAPRMGSDRPSCEKRPLYEISIHAPRMGSDRRFRPFAPRNRYFNPRSPDGERPCELV